MRALTLYSPLRSGGLLFWCLKEEPMLQKATTFVGQIVSLAILAAMPVSFAQVQAGRIVGTVTDPNKGVVPNAKVVITNTATNQTQVLPTNGAGDFVLTPVNPGVYRIQIPPSPFATSKNTKTEENRA